MDKQLIWALGLHLWTEQQLYLLLCTISYIEMTTLLVVLWKKDYFVEKLDWVYLFFSIQIIASTLFIIENVGFFCSLFYINLFLFMIFLIIRKYKYKKPW